MKAEQKTTEQKIAEQRLVLILVVSFTTLSAAFTGLMIALFAGGFIADWIGYRTPWWLGLLIGGLFGFITGFYKMLATFKHSEEYTVQAKAIGLDRLSDEDSTDVGQAIGRLMPGQEVRVWDCHFRADDNAKIVVGDMGMESSSMERNSESKTEQQQTCVYIEFTDFIFPEFQLRPEASGTGFLEALIGIADIDFTDSVEFSRKYLLTGRPDEVVRQLFDKPVRDALARDPGWTIVARKQHLVMYRLNQTKPLDQLDSFLSDCLNVIGLLQSSGSHIPAETINAPVTRDVAMSEASRIGGLVGALVQREIKRKVIEIDEVAAFLKQPVPRKIPHALKNQNRADPFLILFGSAFSGIGSIIFLVGLLADQDLQSRLIFMGVASLAILIGGSILFFSTRFARRRMRILAHGRVREGVIESFVETPFVNGNQRVFQAKVRLSGDAAGQIIKANIQGIPVNAARNAHESQAVTRILQDPNDDSRIMLIDCMAIQ